MAINFKGEKLKEPEDNTDTFGPLTEKEQERLRDLLLKEKED